MTLSIILFVIAVVPGIILFVMTRKLDKKEKESKKILIKIALMEIPFIIAAVIAELVGEAVLQGITGEDDSNLLFIAAFCFLIIAPAEELFKFLGASRLLYDIGSCFRCFGEPRLCSRFTVACNGYHESYMLHSGSFHVRRADGCLLFTCKSCHEQR